MDDADKTVRFPAVNNSMVLLFCGYVFLWLLQIGYRVSALGAIHFEFCYAGLLIACAMVLTPKLQLDSGLLCLVMLFLFTIVLQVPFSYDLSTSIDVLTERIFKFAVLSFLIVSFIRSPRHLRYFVAAFLLACLKMGQEGLVGNLSGGLVWENQGIMRLHGPTPIYAHPNSFAGMAMGTLPFVCSLWKVSTRSVRWGLLALCLLSMNIIVFSGSRTSYVALMVYLVYLVRGSNNKKAAVVGVLCLVSLGLVLLPGQYKERMGSIFTMKEKEGKSSETRVEILRDAWEIFRDNPLGIGVSAFPKKRHDTFGRIQDTHNLYLEIATNLGIQGLAVFSLLIRKLFQVLMRTVRTADEKVALLKECHPPDDELVKDLEFLRSVAHAIRGYLVVRLTLGLFGMDLYEVYWWIAIGTTFSLVSMVRLISTGVALRPLSAPPQLQSTG